MHDDSPTPHRFISEEITRWADAIAFEMPKRDGEAFLSTVYAPPNKEDKAHAFSRITLWQLDDPKYGLRRMQAVRRDSQLSAFCTELEMLLKRELEGEATADEYEALYKKMEPIWAEVGIQKKMWTGFIGYRFKWIGGKQFAAFWTRGWWETWTWVNAAVRRRGQGQTTVLVWSWARAGNGKKPSAEYDERIRALRDYFLATIRS